jgi:GNAT superfamily N-acetyltransferase
MKSSTLLLIHPPADNPVYPCWDAALVAGSLSDAGLEMGLSPTPARVMRVYPLFFKDSVLFSDFLEDQVSGLGVQGFVFAKETTEVCSLTDMCRHLAHWLSIKQPRIYFSLQAGTADPGDQNNLSDLFSSGLRLIHWEGTTRSGISEKILWEASKIGIWNHLSYPDLFREQGDTTPALAKFIVNNPTIVHSFKDSGRMSSQNLIQKDSVWRERVEGLMDYAKVQPLPGIPFWTFLEAPGWLLVYLSQFSCKLLASLRADMANESIICLGSQMEFIYQTPADLAPGILDEICKMVEAGGSVEITHIRSNLERAYLIGYAVENGVIIGNSSLKHPRKVFIERLKQITGVDFTHFVERGYTSVRPEYRSLGVGAKLLEGLTKRAKGYKVFSIISEQNVATQKIAIRNNTKKILTYFSEKLNKEMGIWMPEEMIDTSVMDERDKEK